jgi:dsRNA-specific ribonuclease
MKEQIKKLFVQLEKDEQIELLKELSGNSESSITISELAQLVQKQYGKNIEFTVNQTGLDHCPTITAIAHTPFGDFEGTGSNQKIAKANACEKAFEAMNT